MTYTSKILKRFIIRSRLFLIIIFISLSFYSFKQDSVIIDSNISFDEAVSGIDFPGSVRKDLILADVLYYSFDGKMHKGQIVIHKSLEKDISEIFDYIRETRFPVGKVIPISRYNWNDSASMRDNNTSAFNYRKVKGTKVLSRHSTGRALDLNPWLNPYVKGKWISPPGSVYDPKIPGTLFKDSQLVKYFLKKGWIWGGNWRYSKDYQHFEKPK